LYPHCIRLREPWTREPRDDGGLRLKRGFHRPTISGGERVWLVCEGPTCAASVMLDDRPLGDIVAGRTFWSHDVTELLVERHALTFDVTSSSTGDSLPWREVRLEIRLHSTPEERPA
jgi:hypothetical protein